MFEACLPEFGLLHPDGADIYQFVIHQEGRPVEEYIFENSEERSETSVVKSPFFARKMLTAESQ